MESVSVSELRDHVVEVVDRAARGETVIVTRAGVEIAELHRRRPRPAVSTADLIARRSRLPVLDPQGLRRDLGDAIDAAR